MPHRLRKPFEIVPEPAHVGPVAEAAGQKQEFLRFGRRDRQIARVAPNDAQSVDQITLENVGLPQAGGVLRRDQIVALQDGQGVERVDRAERRVEMAVT